MFLRRWLFVVALLLGWSIAAIGDLRAEAPLPAQFTMSKMKAKILLATRVSLSTSAFRLSGDVYTASYDTKVTPWSFKNESGTVTLEASQSAYERMLRGESFAMKGYAKNKKGEVRQISVQSRPSDASTGNAQVRISFGVIKLDFNGTYRMSEPVAASVLASTMTSPPASLPAKAAANAPAPALPKAIGNVPADIPAVSPPKALVTSPAYAPAPLAPKLLAMAPAKDPAAIQPKDLGNAPATVPASPPEATQTLTQGSDLPVVEQDGEASANPSPPETEGEVVRRADSSRLALNCFTALGMTRLTAPCLRQKPPTHARQDQKRGHRLSSSVAHPRQSWDRRSTRWFPVIGVNGLL